VNNIHLEDDASLIASLTITGSAALMLDSDGDFRNIETVDSTGFTGDLLELDISGQSDGEDLEVALGEGDEKLIVNADTLGANNLDGVTGDPLRATLDGGEGDDNLVVDLAGYTFGDEASDADSGLQEFDFSTVTSFETLTFDRASQLDSNPLGDTLDLSETDFTALVMDAGLGLQGDFTLTGSADFDTITLNKALSTNANAFTLDGFETVTINTNANAQAALVAEDVVTATLNVAEATTTTVTSLLADKLVTLTVNLADGAELMGPFAGSAKAMETVTVTGADDTTVTYFFAEEEESLATIDLSDMAGDVTIGWGGDIDNTLSILIGEADLDYGFITPVAPAPAGPFNASTGRETFTFTGEDIGTINIGDFTSGVGGNADRIDFSQFAAVTGLDDLDIVYTGGVDGDTLVTSDAFEGTITVIGIDLTDDAANFVF